MTRPTDNGEERKPVRGEVRRFPNGDLCRFIEDDDRGEVWAILEHALAADRRAKP